MKSNKLKAFTLAEMLVVLVIASIVISMGFLILNMVRQQVRNIQFNYQKKQEVQFFEATLIRDFHQYNAHFSLEKKELKLINTNDSIFYQFLDKVIVRENDTFKIEVANKKLFLDGLQVKDKKIDAIEINLSKNFSNKQLFIHRAKDAYHYLNN